MLAQITPLVLTRDEKENIGRCLRRLLWANEVVIVDSGSSDETLEVARSAHPNVRIVTREFDSFAGQCNFGLLQIQTAWVLSLDSDYILSDELDREIPRLDLTGEVAGFSADFIYCINGKPLRASLYPPRVVLYRKGCAGYRDEGHGHRVQVHGKVEHMRGKIWHDDRKPLSRWLVEQDKYATLEAEYLLGHQADELKSVDKLRRKIVIAPLVIFIYTLLGQGLILDGWAGWYYVFQRTMAELMLSLRLIEQKLAR